MFLADEILKLLVCEVCFENFNEKEHLPISLFPCGHTFCEYCIKNFNNQTCPACNQKFDFKAKNWAIINLIPRGRIPEVYEQLKEIIENSFGILTNIDTMDNQTTRDYRNNLDWIRESINLRADDLIKRVKELQTFLIKRLDEFEQKWDDDSKKNRLSDAEIKTILSKIKTDIEIEEVKTSQEKLDEHKKVADNNFNILNERIKVLDQLKSDLVSYQDSNFNIEELTSENLFGMLTIENLEIQMTKFKDNIKNDIKEDTYADIDSTMRDFDKMIETPLMEPMEKLNKQNTRDLPKEFSAVPYLTNTIVPPKYPYPDTKKNQDEFESPKSGARKCRLLRNNKTESYGFELKSLKSEGKHFIKGVEEDCPASRAGLRENDLILEVNDEPILGQERELVVKKILKHSKHVDLTVINESDMMKKNDTKSATLDDKRLRAMSMENQGNPTGNRMIVLSRSPGGKGFGFSISKNKSGPHLISEIDKNSPAATSGLKIGDYVLRLNGINLEDKSFSKTNETFKKESEKSERFELEVVDPDHYQSGISKVKRADSADNLDIDEFSDTNSDNEENKKNQLNKSNTNHSDNNLDKRKFIKFFRKNKNKKQF